MAIFASFLLSITLVPAYCAYLLPAAEVNREASREAEAEALAGGWFSGLLGVVIASRWVVVGVAVAAFVGAMALTARQGQELFPSVDSGQITMYVRLASGTRIENTEKVMAEIESTIIDLIGEPDPAFALDPEYQRRGRMLLQ